MNVNWDTVPSRFKYLVNSVLQNRSNDLLIVPWIESLRRPVSLCERTALGLESGLSAAELSELAHVYDEILKREDNLAVLEWCVSADSKESQVAASRIGRLLALLQELGEFGVAPFAGQLIQSKLLPTYRNLPVELEYLREAIDRYCSDLPAGREDGPISQGMYFLRKTARFFTGERKRLRELGARIENDHRAIGEWYRDHRRTPEAGKWLELENILIAAGFLRDDLG